MGFTLVGAAECDMCGKSLASSDDDCGVCESVDTRTMVFRRLQSNETKTIEVAQNAPHDFIWEKFARNNGGTIVPYFLLGDREYVDRLLNSTKFDEIVDIPRRSTAIDYRGGEDLREL